jgi:acetolactate synthase small subunit
MKEMDGLLSKVGLRSADDSPSTIFSQLVNLFRRITHPKSVEAAVTITPSGLPVVIPKVSFGEDQETSEPAEVVEHQASFRLLDRLLTDVDIEVWVVMDRLDEAFQGYPAAEVPALRALFRTYLDLLEFEHLRLKLFVRRDLFARIISGGFVNLTHINARKIEILWDESDLYDLLCRRIRESHGFVETLDAGEECEQLFGALFPEQVDVGDRKPTTWTWMMSRIRDGNGVRPPRNLIDLVTQARTAQLRRDEQQGREYERGAPLITSDSIKRGLQRLSAERVQDTLLAEAGAYAPLVQLFEGGKAEHSEESLISVLSGMPGEVKDKIRVLEDLGFLEQVGDTYKVPILYRDGMGITQGKAF